MEPSGFFSVEDLGLAEYGEVYRRQRELVEGRKSGSVDRDVLIFVEHPAVYTYGRKIKKPALPADVPSFAVERGGEITYHNPGQLVAYPILALKEDERDLHLHLRRLESTLMDVLLDCGLHGERRPGATGVWLVGQEKKIASIGIAVSSWITYHGIALNVDNDLSGFLRVSPCGFAGEVMTSMRAELGPDCPPMAKVKASFVKHFATRFER
jgi:lipoate-protein ligase B